MAQALELARPERESVSLVPLFVVHVGGWHPKPSIPAVLAPGLLGKLSSTARLPLAIIQAMALRVSLWLAGFGMLLATLLARQIRASRIRAGTQQAGRHQGTVTVTLCTITCQMKTNPPIMAGTASPTVMYLMAFNQGR